MNIILYVILFLIGIALGDFWRKTIYKIPRNISLTKRNVTFIEPNSKLNFLTELYYMLLGGITLVVFGAVLQLKIDTLNIANVIIYIYMIIYITLLVIIAGIDKRYLKIEKGVVSVSIILSMLYIAYSYILDESSLKINAIYLGIYVILLMIDTFIAKKYAENNYTMGILMLFNIMLIFSGFNVFAYTLILTAIEIVIYIIIAKIQQKKNGNKKIKLNNIPVGYLLSISNILMFVIASVLTKI